MIFISHSSNDHDAATALHTKLLDRGYDASQLFLDSDVDSGISAGERWQRTLYARLKDCRALIVLCSQNWLDSKWCFAELIYAKASGKEIFPVILESCDFRGVLDEQQAVLIHRDGDGAYERLWRALDTRHLGPRDDFGWPPKDGDACPFPGLLSFDGRYAGVYFGREPETQAVLEELRKMRANSEPRLLMITGGSGSGKSSLLKAGVLPQLTHKSSGTEWLVLPVLRYGQAASPQHTIFEQLAMNVAGARSDWKVLRDAFTAPDAAKSFVDATRDLAVARGSAGATVLLPVDQFEELLAPAAGPDAAAFLRFLREVFGCANGRLLAIGTMRSDHLDVYERNPHALTAPHFGPWRLGPFPRERVRDVIVKPTARAGVEVTSDLLARLERDTPSAESLPLLAFTLEKLYRRYAADRNLELQEYEDLGGMEGAIQKSADAIALAPDVLGAVRLTFVRYLASFNDKDEVVRVTARWSAIPDAARPVLEKFVAERLLVKNDHADEGQRWVSVEVAHEALFRAWPALKKWLDDAADILRWRRDVQRDRAADLRWRSLRPSQLAVARPWLRHRRSELMDQEVEWIRRGIRRERAQRSFAAVIAVIILGFGIYAFLQKHAADRASQVSLGRFLASQSIDLANTRARSSVQSLLLAIEGYRRAPSSVTAFPLRRAMAATPLPIARLKHDAHVHAIRFSPDGEWLATGDDSGKVRIWNYKTQTQLATTDVHHRVVSVAWRPDGKHIGAVADRSQNWSTQYGLTLWNWRTQESPVLRVLPGEMYFQTTADPHRWLMGVGIGELKVWGDQTTKSTPIPFARESAVVSTPMGDRFAVVDHGLAEYRVHVFDTTTGREVAKPFLLRGRMESPKLAFRPDGRALAIGADRMTRIWNWETDTVHPARAARFDPTEIVFSPDGKLVAEIDRSDSLHVWDALTGKDIYALEGKELVSGHIARWARFTNDGRHLVACTGDSSIRVFDISSEFVVLAAFQFTPEATVLEVAMDPTGTFVAVSSDDDWVTVWKLERGHSIQEFRGIIGIVTAPRGNVVALLGPDSRIVDLRSRRTLLRLGNVESPQTAVFSDDGRQFACADAEGRIVLADLRSRETRLLPRIWSVETIRFSPEGRRLLIEQGDGALASIDIASGTETKLLQTRASLIGSFSPDARLFAEKEFEGPIHIYDLIAGKVLGDIASNWLGSHALFSPNGTLIAGRVNDQTLSVWSTKTQAEVLRIPVDAGVVEMTFDSTGRRLAIANRADIHVFDLGSKKKEATLSQIGGQVHTIAFTPDGAYLAAGCEDGNVRIWRMTGDDAVMTIPQAHPFEFNSGTVGFTPDGKYLTVTQGCDQCPYGNFARLILWRPDDVVREACRRALRKKLTPAEWQQFLAGQPYRETCGATE